MLPVALVIFVGLFIIDVYQYNAATHASSSHFIVSSLLCQKRKIYCVFPVWCKPWCGVQKTVFWIHVGIQDMILDSCRNSGHDIPIPPGF
mgnify:CR=1 FL=1